MTKILKMCASFIFWLLVCIVLFVMLYFGALFFALFLDYAGFIEWLPEDFFECAFDVNSREDCSK